MSLEQTTDLYASVLRQLLPEGVYDTAEMTHVADDIYAHAKALAQADIDAHRLLQVLETIPVDLLADYEREYGLPMQCMVPGSQTIEERISVLRWIRQHRNVMNREYLEQILAIFGVTLVDVVKHYPMQCTAPCTAPVNTERLRYKVLLRLQYPMAADMSCIIENYLPGYLRVEWVVDMPWGEWILNAGYELIGDNIRYTAYKTNQRDFYDSFANFDLITALIRSFHDTDMQQWQGFKDAVNILTGFSSWNVESNNSQVNFIDKNNLPISIQPYDKYFYDCDSSISNPGGLSRRTAEEACKALADWTQTPANSNYLAYRYTHIIDNYYEIEPPITASVCKGTAYNTNSGSGYGAYSWDLSRKLNRLYDPSSQPNLSYLSFSEIAQKIISNATSSNEGISLFSQAYLENIVKSISNVDESKQFIKLSDLLTQFDLNKTLRT